MGLMRYDALNLGGPEFTFGKEFLERKRSQASFPYIASNLLDGGSRIPWTREYIIKEVGGIKVAILGVLDPDGLARLPDREQVKGLEVISPEAALNRLLPEVRAKADLVILLSQSDVEKTLALVKAVKGIDVAISSASDDVFFPPAAEKDTAVLLQTGSLGKTLGLLKITLDQKRAIRVSERRYVDLDNSVPDNANIARLVDTFNKTQLARQEKLRREDGEKVREKAVKIGSGPHTVIEITDPDCPFCRTASSYFATRNDVTRYVFFYTIPQLHPKAEAKVRYVLCSKDRAKAYEEAMTGKLDDMKFTPCDDTATAELVKTHKDVGEKVGGGTIGTPLFLIDGQIVKGANIPQIEKILGAKK